MKKDQVSLKMTAYQIVSVVKFLVVFACFCLFLQDLKYEIFWPPLKPLLWEGYRAGVFNEFIRFVW